MTPIRARSTAAAFVELAPDATAATRARRFVREQLGGRTSTLVERAELLVSEVVTNSVRHASFGPDECIRVVVHGGRKSARIEVEDPGPGFDPRPTRPASRLETGWGIYLVDRIARRWGVDRGGGRARVWFELGAPRL